MATCRSIAVAALASVLACMLASAALANPTAAVQDTMAQRMVACAMCHGKEGRSTNVGYFPRIAGKPAGYLYNQLHNFKVGRRRNAAMNHLVEHLSDPYLRDIAQYFAELDLPYPPAQPSRLDAEQERVARTLVFEGVPPRGLPACVSCHGQQMAGQLPAMPGLLTLPADYLIGQLGAWRTGGRHAKAPDCMAEVAKRLTPEEVGAVARWLSAQTLPMGTKPQAQTSTLPMDCGSDLR
jgi:cytochrome c553